MRFELVRERVAALPHDLPAAPAILTPIRLDSPSEPVVPGMDPRRRGRPAAVLVLLFPDDEGQARVLLTTRVPHLSTHAGEVSFPGGSAEADDTDPIETALREAREEVGLDPGQCGLRVTGGLEVFALTVSGYRITPVVAVAEKRPACIPAPDEVARIVEAPVEAFLPDAAVELEERVIRQRLIRYGVYPVEGERIWGATARMLGQLGAHLATEPAIDSAEPTGPTGAGPTDSTAATEPAIRRAIDSDEHAIDRFFEALAPELVHRRPPASDLFVAELGGEIAGLAGCAAWDRERDADDPRGFEGLTFQDGDAAAELTLLAVAPNLRGRGIGRDLTNAIAAAARESGSSRLLAWTFADAAIEPSSAAARNFFRANGFVDLAIDRAHQARGEDRLLLTRAIG
jgi:8-oxo-dGTP pyrophosphatase MutT (NUDIX family)/GNAT superfamily N-acetyltransferase